MNFEKLTQYLDSLERTYGIPGLDCRITKDHREVYRHMAGHSDYERCEPVSEKDLYRMFSATKVVTVTAAMQLVEKGKIGLYDELCKYLPEFSVMRVAEGYALGLQQGARKWPTLKSQCHLAHNRIRIIDLFTMTAGLSYDTASEPLMELKRKSGNKAGTREVVAAIAKMPLLYEPGTRWDYSLAHDVLAGVIEVVSGMSFGEYLKKYIFEPLGVEVLGQTDRESFQKSPFLYLLPVIRRAKCRRILILF